MVGSKGGRAHLSSLVIPKTSDRDVVTCTLLISIQLASDHPVALLPIAANQVLQ